MSIFTCLADSELPTAAKLQRLWAHCILARLIQDVGGWPSTTIEYRLRKFGAGAVSQGHDARQLTLTESAIDRLRRSLDVGLWVQSQLYALGSLRYGISYLSYVEDLDAELIGAIIEAQPKVVLGHRLVIARHLNRSVRHAVQTSENAEISWRLRQEYG